MKWSPQPPARTAAPTAPDRSPSSVPSTTGGLSGTKRCGVICSTIRSTNGRPSRSPRATLGWWGPGDCPGAGPGWASTRSDESTPSHSHAIIAIASSTIGSTHPGIKTSGMTDGTAGHLMKSTDLLSSGLGDAIGVGAVFDGPRGRRSWRIGRGRPRWTRDTTWRLRTLSDLVAGGPRGVDRGRGRGTGTLRHARDLPAT